VRHHLTTFQLHVTTFKYGCTTLCQYIGAGKFAMRVSAFTVRGGQRAHPLTASFLMATLLGAGGGWIDPQSCYILGWSRNASTAPPCQHMHSTSVVPRWCCAWHGAHQM
jgi:hypothetical protein